MLSFSGKVKNTCWKMCIKYDHLLTGVARDDNVDDAWAFVCSLYWIGEKMPKVLMMPGIIFFVKAKRDLEVLPPTQGAKSYISQGQTIKLRYGVKQTM